VRGRFSLQNEGSHSEGSKLLLVRMCLARQHTHQAFREPCIQTVSVLVSTYGLYVQMALVAEHLPSHNVKAKYAVLQVGGVWELLSLSRCRR
jgi:hypothetical protein